MADPGSRARCPPVSMTLVLQGYACGAGVEKRRPPGALRRAGPDQSGCRRVSHGSGRRRFADVLGAQHAGTASSILAVTNMKRSTAPTSPARDRWDERGSDPRRSRIDGPSLDPNTHLFEPKVAVNRLRTHVRYGPWCSTLWRPRSRHSTSPPVARHWR